MRDFKTLAKGLFDNNPNITRYFITSDSMVFELEPFAEHHTGKLKDKTITEVFRPEMSEAEIKEFKQAEALQAKTDFEKTFRSIHPELARCIDQNANRLPGR